MNPIIFLDFDGVLNHDKSPEGELHFEKDNVERLNSLLRATPADIVVISAWRKNMSVDQLNKFFKKNGLPPRIISKASDPKEGGGRGREIEIWLNAHPVKSYVVIDDIDADLNKFKSKGKLVQPDSSKGLSKEDVEDALNILRANA